MPAALSEPDRVKVARAAHFIDQRNEATDQINAERLRLEHADDASLCAITGDGDRPFASRLSALLLLAGKEHIRQDGTLSRICLTLLDDPDDEIAGFVIQSAPEDDADVTARLHAMLDDPRPARWSRAASVLAGRKDSTITDRLLGWFRQGDRDHRIAACSCLCFMGNLESARCRDLLREAWDAGGRDDDDRAMLALGLLGLGDRVGWTFLSALARRADCQSANWAAETIMEYDPALGLDLMLHILEHGSSFEVRWGMVERIAKAAGLPHLWTADGLVEARCWVELQKQKLDLGSDVETLSSLRIRPH